MINDHTVVTYRPVWSSSTAQDLWKHTFYLLHSSSTKNTTKTENWLVERGGGGKKLIHFHHVWKIKQKPIHQIKLCELHSSCGTSPGLPPPPVGIFTFSTLVQDGTKIKTKKRQVLRKQNWKRFHFWLWRQSVVSDERLLQSFQFWSSC